MSTAPTQAQINSMRPRGAVSWTVDAMGRHLILGRTRNEHGRMHLTRIYVSWAHNPCTPQVLLWERTSNRGPDWRSILRKIKNPATFAGTINFTLASLFNEKRTQA